MRKITSQSVDNFFNCKPFKQSNVLVETGLGGSMDYFLHYNLIASYNPTTKQLMIRDAGWQSNTTKERLNGILQRFGISDGIYQKNRTRYIGGEKWTGNKTYKLN